MYSCTRSQTDMQRNERWWNTSATSRFNQRKKGILKLRVNETRVSNLRNRKACHLIIFLDIGWVCRSPESLLLFNRLRICISLFQPISRDGDTFGCVCAEEDRHKANGFKTLAGASWWMRRSTGSRLDHNKYYNIVQNFFYYHLMVLQKYKQPAAVAELSSVFVAATDDDPRILGHLWFCLYEIYCVIMIILNNLFNSCGVALSV